MVGLVTMFKEEETRALSLSALGGQSKKMAVCVPGRGIWTGTETTSTLDLPASQTVRAGCW